jgi:hypothetical protein
VENFSTNRSRPGVDIERVEIRDHVTGDLERVENADLYRAVGDDGIGESADLEIQTSDGSVTRVRFRETWYGTGASAAGVVFGALVTVAGLFLLWRGVRRFRTRRT